MKKRVVVACPAYAVTGGPELLHQLCFTLRKQGIDSIMYYTDVKNPASYKVSEAYQCYKNPYIVAYEDSADDILVVPETMLALLQAFPKSRKVFWWLSVDNFYRGNVTFLERVIRKIYREVLHKEIGDPFDFIHPEKNPETYSYKFITKLYQKKKDMLKSALLDQNDIWHLNQSYYSMDYCKRIHIAPQKIKYLSDYINADFIKKAAETDYSRKEDIILYNPNKGFQITKKIIEQASDLQWIPLVGLSRSEMIALLQRSKLYIDFGNHPGKDRIPREAAICGCCVITGKRGAAAYRKDVPIPEQYKFEDDDTAIPAIVDEIHDILQNYDRKIQDFSEYRKFIQSEELQFAKDVKSVFDEIIAD